LSPAPLPPAWPASANVDLREELRSTERELAAPALPSADEAGGLDVDRSPLVSALEGEAAGLTYIEVVLGDADIDAMLPMVLMLHGRGDRPRIPGGPFGCITIPVRIIMPRAPDPLGPGFTWLSMRVAEERTEAISKELEDRADQLAALLMEVSARRPTLGRPILTGFSQGGLLAFALGVGHPGLAASVIALAGWLPPPLWPSSAEGLPVIRAMHGTDDDTIPLPPTREAVTYLKSLGADVELLEFQDVGHRMSAAMNEQFERWLERSLREQAPSLADRPRDTSVELGDAVPEAPLRCSEDSATSG